MSHHIPFFFVLVIVSFVSKGNYIISSEENLDSDGAIPLLMATRILEFREFPFFYWGQNYMGLLEVWASLPFLFFFGATIQTFVVVEILFSVMISIFLYIFFSSIKEKELGFTLSMFFAMGHPIFNFHFTNSSENYSSSIFLSLSGFYLIKFFSEKFISKKIYFLSGIIFGLGFYNREILILILPWVFVLTFFSHIANYKKIVYFFPGFLLGYTPAILHYLTNPHYKKLIKPSLKFASNLNSGIEFLKEEIFQSIVISGNIYFIILLLALCISGIVFLFSEKNIVLKKCLLYYSLGALSVLLLFGLSESYMLVRYYFYLQIGVLIFSGYALSIIFKKKKSSALFIATIVFVIFFIQSFQDWKKNLNLFRKDPEAKLVSDYLLKHKLQYGFCEYWAGYVVSYFSKDQIHCLIYLDKQSDFTSAYKVIENRASFFLFKKGSNFEKHFIKNIFRIKAFEIKEFENQVLYISHTPTLDFLEPNRENLLQELNFHP
ncbi:MAG: hypothetical protein L6Q54_11815 [Leptospiraceae bacterium]|nr:hypothetical protein [Leptospiraceae bacterium]